MTSPDAPDLNAITRTVNIARHTAFMNPGMLWAREMERVCGGALDVIAALREADTKLAAIHNLADTRADHGYMFKDTVLVVVRDELLAILNGKGE